jgi:hypothetical protein
MFILTYKGKDLDRIIFGNGINRQSIFTNVSGKGLTSQQVESGIILKNTPYTVKSIHFRLPKKISTEHLSRYFFLLTKNYINRLRI